MSLFKKVLSGTPGRNLIAVDFTGEQVKYGDEHRLLSNLANSRLKDEDAVTAMFDKVISWIRGESAMQSQSVEEMAGNGNYLVLLLHDGYDVPYRDINGEIDRERSTDVFSYMLCCVCPVKQSRPFLTYNEAEGDFHSRVADWTVGAPELGFMFPAFEERATNINRAMYYSKDPADLHDSFVKDVFGVTDLVPADDQKESFQEVLQESLGEECSLEVVQGLHDTISGMLAEQKADKTAEPLTLGQSDMKRVLLDCGVSEARAEDFGVRFEEAFGEKAEVPAVNMITPKEFKLTTPSVSIKVNPEFSDLVQTRMIDGKYYIMILADGDVEVNGLRITH